ncbi:hypothetical protein GKC30_04410 [Pseudodesulfovibrio sp. F-1]|uniref:Uncharacterized protein n=1 Tax=Pseudodesulfovibrio alkaliphilus TaxID=2661613 RepID=A0A7K1KLB3_9BACT|nr:hypothetical protein [Pseudodesulfovibrio alkaliphilus]MUM76873.1 hypothetical protein [Pseudodesulfovibrio alkaliphilus]
MSSTLLQATGFKRALLLCREGKHSEAEAILKSLQDEFLAVCEENEALKAQLHEVAAVLDLADNVRFDGQKYWLTDGGEQKGPYCQVCYDRDGLLINLQRRENNWECRNCQSRFMVPSKTAVPARRPTQRGGLKKAVPLFFENDMV